MKTWLVILLLTASQAAAQDCGWAERMPVHGPTQPLAGAMTFDSSRGVAVLFSAKDSPNLDERETLEWDGDDWLLRSVEGPQTRYGSAIVYDSDRNVCVLFGGRRPGFNTADTWEWDGQAWTQAFPVSKPKTRYYHTMAFDSGRGVAVMWGGFNEDDVPFGDTWEWNGTTWTKVATDGPGASAYNSMAYDAQRGVTVLYGASPFGNETWEWDGESWAFRTSQGPGRLAAAAMVYDSNRQVCVLYGGYCQDCGNSPSDETWQWDGQIWTKLNTPENPGRRAEHAMAYDSARHATVLFGGESFGHTFDDTWELVCEPPCYADFTGKGTLDIFDFLAFVNAFNAGEGDKADCDSSGSLDLFDFLCFTNAFNKGC